jgi:hypothetical protein
MMNGRGLEEVDERVVRTRLEDEARTSHDEDVPTHYSSRRRGGIWTWVFPPVATPVQRLRMKYEESNHTIRE